MMTMLMTLLACLATWALVALMLGDARDALRDALAGDAQSGGWMPSALPMATVRTARRR
jgi:hypothetical protein